MAIKHISLIYFFDKMAEKWYNILLWFYTKKLLNLKTQVSRH